MFVFCFLCHDHSLLLQLYVLLVGTKKEKIGSQLVQPKVLGNLAKSTSLFKKKKIKSAATLVAPYIGGIPKEN